MSYRGLRRHSRPVLRAVLAVTAATLLMRGAFTERVGRAQDFAFQSNNVQVFNVNNTGVTGTSGFNLTGMIPAFNSSFNVTDVAVGDFSGDGIPDLVVIDGSPHDPGIRPAAGSLALLTGVGDGTFAAPQLITLSAVPVAFGMSDISLDGLSDVVVAEASSTGDVFIDVILGPSLNAFRSLLLGNNVGVPVAVALGRLNNDSFPDIALGTSAGVLTVLHSPGAVFQPSSLIPVSNPRDIAIGQSNLFSSPATGPDTDLDLFIARSDCPTCSGFVDIFENNATSTGTFPSTPSLTLQAGNGTVGVLVVDVNGDNRSDVIALNQGSGTISTFIANSSASGYLSPVNTSLAGSNPVSLSLINFNNDGKSDIVVGNGNGTVSVLQNTTANGATTPTFNRTDVTCGDTGPASITAGDLRRDNFEDIIVGSCYFTQSAATPTPTRTASPTATSTTAPSSTATATATGVTPVAPPSSTPTGITPVAPPSSTPTGITPVAPPTGITPVTPPSPTPVISGSPTPTATPPTSLVQQPKYSVAPNGPTGCDPADILSQPGTTGSPCAGPGSPDVLISCAALTFATSCSAPGGSGPPSNDDVKALSFGNDRIDPTQPERLFFSVDTNSRGCAGDVTTHAAQGHPDGDEFASVPAAAGGACPGSNGVFLSAPALGLRENSNAEPPNNDDELDALAWGPPPAQPFFTLAPGSPTLARLGAFSSDILTTPVLNQGPSIALSHTTLRLSDRDVIDGFCLFGAVSAQAVLFSLAPGSPSLAGPDGVVGTADDLSPADVLRPGPVRFRSAGQYGLLASDNIDAMKCSLPAPLSPLSGVGGSGFTLTSLGGGQVAFTWQPGSGQASYRLLRVTAAGETTVATPAANDTSATDSLPTDVRVACYRLETLDAAGRVLARSDTLCLIARLAFGAGPRQIAIALNESDNALLAWSNVPGATGYILLPLGTSRLQLLANTTTAAADNTGGVTTCYVVVARSGTSVIGFSDPVCGVPRTFVRA